MHSDALGWGQVGVKLARNGALRCDLAAQLALARSECPRSASGPSLARTRRSRSRRLSRGHQRLGAARAPLLPEGRPTAAARARAGWAARLGLTAERRLTLPSRTRADSTAELRRATPGVTGFKLGPDAAVVLARGQGRGSGTRARRLCSGPLPASTVPVKV